MATAYDLTSPGAEPITSRTDSDVFNHYIDQPVHNVIHLVKLRGISSLCFANTGRPTVFVNDLGTVRVNQRQTFNFITQFLSKVT